jgi:cardiolipin synthase
MTWLAAHLAIVAISLLAVASATVVLQQRRTPQATLAWLMFLVLVPYVAVPAFITLGFRKRRSGTRRFAFGGAGRQISAGNGAERMLVAYGLPAATAANDFRLLTGGGDAWSALLVLIDGARSRIDVTLYALGDDSVGREFCACLAARARDGVTVRVLLDTVGSFARPRAALRDIERAGGHVHLCATILDGAIRGHLNLRNHRKMVVVDGQHVWSGGRNVAREYLGPEPWPGRWSDLSFTAAGPIVAHYARIFRSDWAAAGGALSAQRESDPAEADEPLASGRSVLQIVPAGPDVAEDPLHDVLVHMFHAAQRRIWIVTPYFLPTEPLMGALAIARRRGVDVRLLVPATSNQAVADLARGAYLRDLARAGCQILRHTGGMIHTKAVVVDDLALVGTANLDARSLLLNFEVMLLLYAPADAVAVADHLRGLMEGAAPGPLPATRGRRLVEGFFRLGAPFL